MRRDGWSLVARAIGVGAVLAATAGSARADVPKGTAGSASASTGSTDLAKGGFETAVKQEEDKEKRKDATELAINAGGMLTGGNARLFAATVGSTLRLRRSDNQLKVVVAGNYGMSASTGADWHTSVENLQGVERYDRFLGNFTVFLGSQQRHDRFQGLDLRFQIDPGFGYYFINKKTELLWIEAGYDFRYDVRRDDALAPVDATGAPIPGAARLDKTTVVHSARAFAGYETKLGDTVKFNAGLEYIQSVEDKDVYRLNGDVALTAKISKSFSIALAFAERYENHPLPGKQKLDTMSSMNLVYSLF